MEREITELIENCTQFLIKNCYASNRIAQYKSLWNRGILQYMKEKEKTIYTTELGKVFIKNCYPEQDFRPTAREMIRSIRFLDDYLTLGYIRNKAVIPVQYTLHGEIGLQMIKLINHLQTIRRSSHTIGTYKRYMSRFLIYLTNVGINSVHEINEHHILKFVSTTENQKIDVVSRLRVLFNFWYENHISTENYADILKNYRWRRKEKVPSYFSKDEIRLIEVSIDRTGEIGKRNYAMFLLGSRLGLRASDIANLQFHNIDWEKSEISLTQYKTKKIISLPLLADVGNAIIDYLKYGRRKSDSQQIFLSCRPPYGPATSSIVCDVIRGIIKESGVVTSNRHHGAHSLRHSLASCLINYGTPIPVISGILGHRNSDTTRAYLQIDIASLQKCVLPVPLVEDDFYTQKGGVFYE